MPVCKKCEKSFKNRIIMNGEKKNVSKRKYCLECSPFDMHNTRKIESVASGDLVICVSCGRKYTYDRSMGHRKQKCNSCMSYHRYEEVKRKAVSILGNKCSRCGYDKYIGALEFHHRDAKKKDFAISKNANRRWEVVEREVRKCDLLCSNCHKEVHYELNMGD